MPTIAHKIELQPNNVQSTYFSKACGTARFAYNWGLAQWKKLYDAGERPYESIIRKQLNAIKREQYPWMLEVTKCAVQLAIKEDLQTAFKKFFAKQASYPKFKKKGHKDSFHISNDQFDIKGDHIRIPNLGWVRMRESLRFIGKILSATISRVANRWFVSITVEADMINNAGNNENQATAGVDLGIKKFAVVSHNQQITEYAAIRPHKALLGRLQRCGKSLSRKIKGSKNRYKARLKLAKLHARVANIRNDYIEKTTTELANNYSQIAIEDLNVSGMSKNHKLSKSILDMGFYRFRNRLETKLKARGKHLILADRWYPSSKICNCCNHKNVELTLKDRIWVCPNCNVLHDRDANAAINLEKLAVSFIAHASETGVEACGAASNGGTLSNQWSTSYAVMKQEFNSKIG